MSISGFFRNGFVRVILFLICVACLFWLLVAQPAFRSSRKSEVRVSAMDLERHVRKLAEEFSPRSAAHIGNMNRTADYIKSEFAKCGSGKVTEQWFQVGSHRYRNISLVLGDPKAERIVVGAHYDGFGPHPAADDNASGIAGLIELAKLMSKNSTEKSIEFVAYPLEEPPYFGTSEMGSRKHVDQIQKAGVRCKYMISLEMIGYFSDEPKSQAYPLSSLGLFYPDRGNFIMVVGDMANRKLGKSFKVGMKGSTDLPVYSIAAPSSIPGIDFSDHRNYWEVGIPAIMITDTAFYRNTAYHSARDTADRLDYEKMAKVVVGVYQAILAN